MLESLEVVPPFAVWARVGYFEESSRLCEFGPSLSRAVLFCFRFALGSLVLRLGIQTSYLSLPCDMAQEHSASLPAFISCI